MGQNIFRFTLSHSSGSQVISEPEGWAKIKITLERDKEYYSLIEVIETPFVFYGSNGVHDGGMSYLLNIKNVFGVDAQVTMFIEISQDESTTFESLYIGLISMESVRTLDSRRLEAVIMRNDFWAKFVSRRDTPVDILSTSDLYGNSVTPISHQTLNLSSQPILSKYSSYEKLGSYLVGTTPLKYIQFQPDTIILDEVEETFNIGSDFSEEIPVWIHEFKYGGDADFDIRYEISRTLASGFFSPQDPTFSTSQWRVYFKKNDETPIMFTHTDANYVDPSVYTTWNPASPAYTSGTNVGTMVATFVSTVTISAGDIVRVYLFNNPMGGSLVFWGTDGQPSSTLSTTVGPCPRPAGMIDVPTYYKLTQNTLFDASTAESFFLHDVGAEVTKRIIANNSFYSDYIGSTHTVSRVYPNDGCGWAFILLRGLQIRQYDLASKPFSISFKQWWDGINPILNLGLTYDEVGGNEVIRVEDKEFFFNESPILYLDWVNNITESYDKDYIFNKIKIGYKKWQSEDISGIDDPQTNHEYATLFKTVGQEIIIQSEFIAASLAFETTRRKTKQKSEDYKFDDDTFIVSVDPVVSGGINPLTTGYFDSVTHLLNASFRYNINLSPARNLLRWGNFLTGCLQKDLTSSIKFVRGEGNYDMETDWNSFVYGNCLNITDTNLGEKQDIDMPTYSPLFGYLFQPILLEFDFPLSFGNYKLIRENRTRAIAVSESDSGHKICYIKKMQYDMIKSLASFTVWIK